MSKKAHVRIQKVNVRRIHSKQVDMLMTFLTCDGRKSKLTNQNLKIIQYLRKPHTHRRYRWIWQLGETMMFESLRWQDLMCWNKNTRFPRHNTSCPPSWMFYEDTVHYFPDIFLWLWTRVTGALSCCIVHMWSPENVPTELTVSTTTGSAAPHLIAHCIADKEINQL